MENSAGENVKYSSTGIWNEFLLYLSQVETSTGESVKYRSKRIWNVFQFDVIISY